MTKTRNLSDLLDANGKVDNTDILNVDAAKITTGTLDAARINNASLANVTALPFSAGTDWQSTIVTGTTLTAEAGKGYWIDTTSNACTVTLPASASVGDTIEFSDYARTWGTNNVTINPNSLNFQGNSSPNPVYDVNGQSVRIVYSGATQGWIPTSDDDVTLETPQTVTIDYLVIAGGGGGGSEDSGYWGAGGGAGGYRNSYNNETSGGGGSSETALNLNAGITLTATIGAGGAKGANGGNNGSVGSDTTLIGTGVSITSNGGGYGAGAGGGGNNGGNGGSGGGAADGTGASASGGTGTANQGFAGGDATGNTGGSGGGAGGAGQDGSTSNLSGGIGLASSITGSSVTRGVGGIGAIKTVAGTTNPNTGKGGDGDADGIGYQSDGSSGVVILRLPTANYTGTTTGSPTVDTDGSDTIITFNSSGSYTV